MVVAVGDIFSELGTAEFANFSLGLGAHAYSGDKRKLCLGY